MSTLTSKSLSNNKNSKMQAMVATRKIKMMLEPVYTSNLLQFYPFSYILLYI